MPPIPKSFKSQTQQRQQDTAQEKSTEIVINNDEQSAQLYWAVPSDFGEQNNRVELYLGDVIQTLQKLPAKSVHTVITSPPYWGLRDYGTGVIVGGNSDCEHDFGRVNQDHRGRIGSKDNTGNAFRNSSRYVEQGRHTSKNCSKCGAIKNDKQLGSEPIPDCLTQGKAQCGECFICSMIAVFREVKRVLRDDGTMWLNLGDTYSEKKYPKSNIVQGNLVGIPWRVALALQANGWILRQDIIWHKTNPMPEGMENRCTKSHEYIFLFAKSRDYYYDQDSIRENPVTNNKSPSGAGRPRYSDDQMGSCPSGSVNTHPAGRNKRSVWSIPTQGYPGAHFAAFPEKLIEPCILVGTSEHGCCAQCKAPWERQTESDGDWQPTCECYGRITKTKIKVLQNNKREVEIEKTVMNYESELSLQDHPIIPCTVLDPFVGSGTTVKVAIQHGRHGIGIDLSEKYLRENAIARITEHLISENPSENLSAIIESQPLTIGKKATK